MIRQTYPYSETVYRLRGVPVTDPYSGELTGLSWTTPTRTRIDKVVISPATSSESSTEARAAVTTGHIATFPRGSAEVTRLDRIEVRGEVWEVDGDVAVPVHPITGTRYGFIAALKRIGG